MPGLLQQIFGSKGLSRRSPPRLDRCFACHRSTQHGVIFPEDGVGFCYSCFNTTPCSCCSLPCGQEHRRLSDGRVICTECYSTALMTPRQLAPMYDMALKFFRRQLKMKLKNTPRLKVVDSRFLTGLQCPPNTWGLYTDLDGDETIFILNGIAAEQSLIVLAHELTHYWQKFHGPKKQTMELFEGFAVWTAYKLAEQKGLNRAMLTIRRNGVEPYYTGLRKIWALERKKGVKATVRHARTQPRL